MIRDLFVELPRAVFDALHAVAEGALYEAEARHLRIPTLRSSASVILDNADVCAMLRQWLGVDDLTWGYEPDGDGVEVLVRLRCRCTRMVRVSDRALRLARWEGPREFMDAFAAALSGHVCTRSRGRS